MKKLTRSQQMFEEMIEGMTDQEAKEHFKAFLDDGLELLSAEAQNYLVDRINELTDKTTNDG